MRSSRKVRAFTLPELIVVVAVIGLFLTFLLLWINPSRDGSPRRSVCLNNMRQLALAVVNFDSQKNQYPGNRDALTLPDGSRLARPLLYMIMPQLERNDLYEAFSATNHPHDGVPDIHLNLLICPSAVATNGTGATRPASNYICNTGMPDWSSAEAPPDWPANGVFQDRYLCAAQGHKLPNNNGSYLNQHDGATNTLMFSERLAFGRWNDMAEHEVGFIWHPRLAPGASSASWSGAPAFDAAKYQQAQPSSGHPGMINVAFCDDHVRSIDDRIDYRVYAQLMTPWGDKAAYPGLHSGARHEVEEAFRCQSLPDEFR